MFNKDFYPTPDHVIDLMGIDCYNKVILEPSAGKGNIVEWLKSNGAKSVLACENNTDLAEIVKTKAHFLKNDFLKVRPEEISHIHMIIMNPPFSTGAKHLLHAWEVAPSGCEIISLINDESLQNDYTSERKNLLRIIKEYGRTVSLGDVFTDAERRTNVHVGLVKLYKPSTGSNEFDGFFMDDTDEESSQGEGLMQFNSVLDAVNRYVYAVKLFDEHSVINERMSQMTKPFGVGGFSIQIGYDNHITDRETFKKALQRKAWNYLFAQMNLSKYVTSGVMKDINKFVEEQSNVPFTMKNVFRMFEIIIGTREETFNRALVEAVDKFTEYTHENRYHTDGWKTNSGHMLNKKIILGWMFESCNGYLSPRHSGNQDKMKDLMKVLCAISGEDYNRLPRLYNVCRDVKPKPNEWFSWDFEWIEGEGEHAVKKTKPGFFEIKGFKKGTMHAKFKDHKVWESLNRKYAKIKGQVLPERMI